MRLRVNVNRLEKPQPTWTITYSNPELAGTGVMTVSADKNEAFPVIKPENPSPRWNQAEVLKASTNVAVKQVNQGDVEAFGKHLFEVLIGAERFDAVSAAGPLEAIEISTDDADFSRLPWEMLWFDDDFAAHKGVGFVRVVKVGERGGEPTAEPTEILLDPKVLFVIGSDVNDARIRPGAEYLGLLRRLEQRGLAIESHVLSRATPKLLEDTVHELRPSVVHFICHGGVGGTGYLQLVSDDKGKLFEQITAEQLVSLTGGIPRAMIMNACETAGAVTRPSLDTPALALKMALKGTPVVIGMAGRVADRACRLFTRRFYEALVSGEAIDKATATARKEAMDIGTDPRKTVDWAMPTIFLHDRTRVRFDESKSAVLKHRMSVAAPMRQLSDPGFICGRGECLDAHRNLLDGRKADRPRVLVLKVPEKASSIKRPQYGKTRLVEEIGARAATRGHVPCILKFPSLEDAVNAPKTAWELAKAIVSGILEVRAKFGFDETIEPEVLRLQAVKAGSADANILSAEVRTQLALKPMLAGDGDPPAAVIRMALLADLESLAREARVGATAVADLKVVVLFDDLHAYGKGGRTLVEEWLSEYGLGRAARDDAAWSAGRGPIPVVMSYSAVTLEIYKADVDAIKTFTELRPTLFRTVDLKAFDPPSLDDLPYQQFLLSRAKMLVLRADLPPDYRAAYLELLHSTIAGVPSRLSASAENGEVHAVVESALRLGALEDADDDKLLAALHGGV